MIEFEMMSPLLIALFPGLWSFGHRRRMIRVEVILLLLPLLLMLPGSLLLGAMGLTWRSIVWKWSGLCFLAGVVVLFIWCGAYLCREIPGEHWHRLAVWFTRGVIILVTAALCLGFNLFSSFFVLLAADLDHTQERDGQMVVAQYLWIDGCNYYAYHGPLLRGMELLEGSTDLEREEEAREQDVLQEKTLRILGLQNVRGIVEASIDTHGGFHNDGETFVQLYFAEETALEQIEASEEWTALPLPEELTVLAKRCHDGIPAVENGYYWFQDRQAEDRGDYSETLDRYSYNFTLALYDTDSRRLYYWKLDT